MQERVWHVYGVTDGPHNRSARGVGSTAARLEPTYDFREVCQACDNEMALWRWDGTEKQACSAWMRGRVEQGTGAAGAALARVRRGVFGYFLRHKK
jgi:hypothetical protein